MTVTPSARSCRTTSNSRSLSRCDSAELGSSSTSTRARWRMARAISTSCISAIDSRLTRVSGSSVSMPSRPSAARASRRISRAAAERATGRRSHVGHDDVFGDRQGRAERQLLVDDDDAGRAAGERRGERRSALPSTRISPSSGCKVAGEDIHQRRLAGAVLADDGMHLAWPEIDRDAVERQNAREPLGHPGDLDQRRTISALGHPEWAEPRRPAARRHGSCSLLLGHLADVVLGVDADAGVEIVDRLDP